MADARRRRANASVVAGSVWESRMKSDEVKGGIKVFNGDSEDNNNNNNIIIITEQSTKMKKPQLTVGKRKTRRSDQSVETGSIAQNSKSKASDKQLSDGIKEPPIRANKGKSEIRDLTASVDGIRIPRSPIPTRKTTRSNESCKEIVVSTNSIQLRKVKSESVKIDVYQPNNDNVVQLRKVKSESHKELGIVNSLKCIDEIEKTRSESEEQCKEFGVCEEKIISTSNGVITVKTEPADEDDLEDDFEDEEFEEDEYEEEIDDEIEKRSSCEVKEINLPEPSKVTVCDQVKKPNNSKVEVENGNKIANEVKKFQQFNDRSAPVSSSVHKQSPPVIKRPAVYQNSTPAASDQYQRFTQQTQNNKLQNLVDLVMWRDISRSAFVFGIGTFTIISSSYTQDLNISFISVISYLGLVYLAAIFLYRSILCRGIVDPDDDDRSCVLGEGEAIWLMKLVLPYLNEALLKLKALFSGDPATTMKLAVLLFVLARCSNSITIWKMVKLGFLGVFTVPKACSSYSTQLTAYGKFWIRRFEDAWNSCSHKKAVAIAAFTLMWNLSSVVARIWTVFMLFVAVRYYHQSTVQNDWEQEDTAEEVDDQSLQTLQKPIRGGPRGGRGPTILAANKVKKAF